MIIVNTGNGKGKTTAAVGQIIRSLGRGWKVCLIQLFKGEEFYGEQKVLTKLQGLDFFSFAPKHPFCFPKVQRSTVEKQCRRALKAFEKLSKAPCKYDLIVLEEFNIATREGYIAVGELLTALGKADPRVHVIVTGRGAAKELTNIADLVTEMREIKHPFNKGKMAVKGIEF